MIIAIRRATIATLVFSMAAISAQAADRNEPEFADVPRQRESSLEELPPDRIITDLSKPLHLKLSGAPILFLSEVGESDANFTITPLPCENECKKMTMVSFSNRSGSRIKVDLWISPDGETWHYTSSCPLGVTYESWPHPIPYLAIARPRSEPADSGVCR